MDVKQYYRKLREIESTLTEQYILVVSLETPDGGKAGRASEVPREIAAKMLLEGRAALASEKKREVYFQEQAAAKKAAHRAELARRVQVAIIADPELETTTAGKQGNQLDSGK